MARHRGLPDRLVDRDHQTMIRTSDTLAGAMPEIPATFSRLDALPKAFDDLPHVGPRRRIASLLDLLPGLAITAAAVTIAWFVNDLNPTFSPLTCAVLLGAVAANMRVLPRNARAGLGFAGKRLMRLGIVLLGLKLALSDVIALGWGTLLITVGVVVVTFFGTAWLGRRMGLPGDQPLLVATGFSICGASAVAAMNSVTDSEDDDVITSVALVTLCGTLAILLLPLLHHPLGLTDLEFGRWVGASVHDVGQVVATAQTAGPASLDQAVVVKMMRIAMLAPLVGGVAIAWRRRARASQSSRTVGLMGGNTRAAARARTAAVARAGTVALAGGNAHAAARPKITALMGAESDGLAGGTATAVALAEAPEFTEAQAPEPARDETTAKRPPLVPLFVLGFLAMVGLRSAGILSTGQVNVSQDAANLLMAAGLFALGTGVDVPKLARTGGRALVLGLLSWLMIAGFAYLGVRLTM